MLISPRRVSDALANPYTERSISGRMRARRWQELLTRFPDLSRMRVVDIGGDVRHWETCPARPAEIVFVNLYAQAASPGYRTIVADACGPVSELDGERFDLAYSNSVIEHVGGHYRRKQLAENVRRLAPAHWVQTPYRYFPIEPHWLFPGFQFLPVHLRARITPWWPLGLRQATGSAALDNVLEVELLSRPEMRHYFPDGDLWVERIGGVAKSLVAVKS